MRTMSAWVLLACSAHLAFGLDLAQHERWVLPDREPRALTRAFVDADAQGLQTSSDYWPLIQRFTTWQDGPGWDAVGVTESFQVGEARVTGQHAQVAVVYRMVGTLTQASDPACPSGACMSLEPAAESNTTIVYRLKRIAGRWRIEGPQSGPIVGVRFAIDHVMQDAQRCVNGDCLSDPVVRALSRARQR